MPDDLIPNMAENRLCLLLLQEWAVRQFWPSQ